MTLRSYQAQIDDLLSRVTALEAEVVKLKERPPRASLPTTWTVRSMLAEIGQTGSKPIGGMLFTLAHHYSRDHNLEVVQSGTEKKYDYFKDEAAKYAMAEARKYLD